MTVEEEHILKLALLSFEEAANAVLTDYFERHHIRDGGDEIIGLVSAAINDRYREVCAGEGDQLLGAWKRGSSVN